MDCSLCEGECVEHGKSREGVIEGLQQACGLLLATVPEDALVHIRAEIERPKGERP